MNTRTSTTHKFLVSVVKARFGVRAKVTSDSVGSNVQVKKGITLADLESELKDVMRLFGLKQQKGTSFGVRTLSYDGSPEYYLQTSSGDYFVITLEGTAAKPVISVSAFC